MRERRYRGHQRSRLSEVRVNTGSDIIYEGARDLRDLVNFLDKQAKRPARGDIVIGLETHFGQDELDEMVDTLFTTENPLRDRLLVGVREQVIIVKPIIEPVVKI